MVTNRITAKIAYRNALIIILLGLLALIGLRVFDWFSDRSEWIRLQSHAQPHPIQYSPEMVASLPEAVQRYFNYVIKPGTPLLKVAEIEMDGLFSLGSRENPNYQRMNAKQILAAPDGFVWQLALRDGVPISGSDSGLWTRFRILGLVPVARLGGDENHRRAAFGRFIAEAVFWTPAALLPSPFSSWEQVDKDTAKVNVIYGGVSQSVTIQIASNGQPLKIEFPRWSDANPKRTYQLQPFGGTLEDFREVQGYRIPFRVEAGNMFGTNGYFPFYKATIKSVKFY